MTSIRHFPAMQPLPDWRNFGVVLRVLLAVNALAGITALLQTTDLAAGLARYVEFSVIVEPVLLAMLAVLAGGRDLLWRLPLRLGQAVVVLLAGGLAGGLVLQLRTMGLFDTGSLPRAALLAMLTAGSLLGYFEWRSRAFSPALAEARLAALNARIRPHFLFNSLNAVLSLIRIRPQQAEAALESLAELFRAAMRDPGELPGLGDEIALGRQYLELEQLRLGERLAVDWQIDADLPDLPVPPLMLQPLLENAVYHGIEPRPEGGTVRVAIKRRGEELIIAIGNPTGPQPDKAAGKHMALANIRERLALYYDLEARLEIEADDRRYEVRITLPCRQKIH